MMARRGLSADVFVEERVESEFPPEFAETVVAHVGPYGREITVPYAMKMRRM